jgi:two-component system phosphate regulon response regulator PhoB
MVPDEQQPAGRALILVVEQDPQMRRLERYFLEQAGFAVEFADDGHKGLAAARRLIPDIVVAEILVGGLDGLSVCRALKADPATRSIIVLIFSILAAEQRALEAGADGFVRKPLDDVRLVESVERLLAAHRRKGKGDGPT